ncbi:MAG: DivIVA domain-containing protein, partial [Clostridia bacterium]|nr:DivIVA domain-containing protein [Clostridia bacterium]
MDNFSRTKYGYSPMEVDEYLARIKLENETRMRKQNERIEGMKRKNHELETKIEFYKRREAQISKALVTAVQKSSDIEESARAVYDLEVKRVQLLYKKWEIVLTELKEKYGSMLSAKQLDAIVGDFENALSVTLQSQKNVDKNTTYTQSVLERMQHRVPSRGKNGNMDPSITLKETEVKVQYDEEGNRLESVRQLSVSGAGVSMADRFLSGEDVDMPECMGDISKELHFPPREFAEAMNTVSESGFSLKE